MRSKLKDNKTYKTTHSAQAGNHYHHQLIEVGAIASSHDSTVYMLFHICVFHSLVLAYFYFVYIEHFVDYCKKLSYV